MDKGCGVGAIMVQLDEVGFTPHGGVWWSGKVGVLAYTCTCAAAGRRGVCGAVCSRSTPTIAFSLLFRPIERLITFREPFPGESIRFAKGLEVARGYFDRKYHEEVVYRDSRERDLASRDRRGPISFSSIFEYVVVSFDRYRPRKNNQLCYSPS